MKFGFIQAEKAAYPVRMLCRTLLVSASGFYAWSRRGPSPRSQEDAALKVEIRAAHVASGRAVTGVPAFTADLKAGGQHVGRKRVARLMQEEGLAGQREAALPCDDRLAALVRRSLPNVVEPELHGVGAQQGLGDRHHLHLDPGGLALPGCDPGLVLAARRGLGTPSPPRRDSSPSTPWAWPWDPPAPSRAWSTTRTAACQYASGDYRSELAQRGIVCSMSRKGDCWDNAVAESFFSTIKAELVYRTDYVSRSQARASIFEYIEAFYNGRRRHSALGYLSPVEHEIAAARKGYAAADRARLQARRGAA